MSVKTIEIVLPPKRRGMHLITRDILERLGPLPESGLLNLFVRHTGCGLTINENYDPAVRHDLARVLDRLVPDGTEAYSHNDEGPDDMPAHVKSTLTGAWLDIPIVGHRPALGTWQGIYLCEFRDAGGPRHVVATVLT